MRFTSTLGAVLAAALLTGCSGVPGAPTPLTDIEREAHDSAAAAPLVRRLAIDSIPNQLRPDLREIRVTALGERGDGIAYQHITVHVMNGEGTLEQQDLTTDVGGVAKGQLWQTSDRVTVMARHSHARAVAIMIPMRGAPEPVPVLE